MIEELLLTAESLVTVVESVLAKWQTVADLVEFVSLEIFATWGKHVSVRNAWCDVFEGAHMSNVVY